MEKGKRTKKEKVQLIQATEAAIQKLFQEEKKIDFQSVARELGVARSTLYRNPTVRSLISNARNSQFLSMDSIDRFENEIEELKERVGYLEETVRKLEKRLIPDQNNEEELSDEFKEDR